MAEASTLGGSLIALDALRHEDGPALVELDDDEVRRFFRHTSRDALTIVEAERSVEVANALWGLPSGRWTWAVRRTGDPRLIGRVDVWQKQGYNNKYVDVWIGKPYRRAGLAREAVSLALDYAFRILRWPWIEAQIDAENAGSIRLAESLGRPWKARGSAPATGARS